MRKQNTSRKSSLDYLDKQLNEVKVQLTKLRSDRDEALNGPDGVNAMKQKTALLSNPKMSEDQRKRLIEKQRLEEEVLYLQGNHLELT